MGSVIRSCAEIHRYLIHLKGHHGVQKPWLLGEADGLGFIGIGERGDAGEMAQRGDGPAQIGETVAKVGTQR